MFSCARHRQIVARLSFGLGNARCQIRALAALAILIGTILKTTAADNPQVSATSAKLTPTDPGPDMVSTALVVSTAKADFPIPENMPWKEKE